MPASLTRRQYAALYGPTTGDRVRLGDTDLWIRIERDDTSYGDEVLVGFGKTVRDAALAGPVLRGDSELDMLLANAIVVDPVLGIFKSNIGIKDGRVAGIGRAGNPNMVDDVDLLISTNTAIMPCQGLIVTPGGVDSHVHLITPRVIPAALSNGITTIVAMGSGPAWDIGVNPAWTIDRMFEAFENVPLNVAFLARGCASRPDGLRRTIEEGAAGLKIHEDLGASPAVVDCALGIAEEYDVAVAMHTDGLNEWGMLDETVSALRGRAVHAYHVEGAGGGHAPNLLEIVRHPHVLPSSTNPTIPYTRDTAAEQMDMIMMVHALSPDVPTDIAAARARVRPTTIAAENLLHDLGAIAMTSSDSLGMGRIGETVLRTWQLAHANKHWLGSSETDDNARVRRYVAKYTINPARTHGLDAQVGSLQVGKLADVVIWRPELFGVKPELVIKGGMVAWGVPGDGNAASDAEPLIYGPQYGALGHAAAALSLGFVSQASLANGRARALRTARIMVPVSGTRRVRKSDMLYNDALPDVRVDPSTLAVTCDGRPLTCEPLSAVPLGSLYRLG